MPSYDFRCKKCGHKFEMRQGMNDPNPPCPCAPEERVYELGTTNVIAVETGASCGGETEKMFTSAPPVHFKGGGWFADGYSKK